MESKTSDSLHALVLQLSIQEQRESALLELSKRREEFPELAPILWHSFGTIAALLQEIVSIYPLLSPPQLTAQASNRACNALALLQCVASHYDTRTPFLNGAWISSLDIISHSKWVSSAYSVVPVPVFEHSQ